ncbi:carbohydrate ABC transporter permease [Microlunatus speluncae]|uniref:carbohydrate ABC transporter permease n=1 Tax=Microlunatus speluncae TaxID=2594267 RepID=UPI0012665DF5|nr:sugar ABC transporter permease [Microlunatus speluncae]
MPTTTSVEVVRGRRRVRPGVLLWCYLFMIPAAILAGMFTFYPMIMSWYISFLDWSGIAVDSTFVGWANYAELLGDQLFWGAFGRSFVFMAVGTPIQVILALLVAVALNNQVRRLSTAFRTLFFLPTVTTVAIVGVVMSSVFSVYDGPVNEFLETIGVINVPVDFLGDPNKALWTVIGVQVWKNVGITMIYWLASLQTVPQEFYEAARVDGAGRWQQLTQLTVPLLLPFAVIIIVLTAHSNLHTFAIVQAMTEGGPYFSTQVIEVFIYQTAFVNSTTGGVPRLGYASAAGCLFGVATLFIALLQAWAARAVARARSQF